MKTCFEGLSFEISDWRRAVEKGTGDEGEVKFAGREGFQRKLTSQQRCMKGDDKVEFGMKTLTVCKGEPMLAGCHGLL